MQDAARLLRVGREQGSEYFTEIGMRLRVGGSSFVCLAALANACGLF